MAYTEIRPLRGTQQEWKENDIVPGEGELALLDYSDGDYGMKQGDGNKKFSQLPFVYDGKAIKQQVTSVAENAETASAAATSAVQAAEDVEEQLAAASGATAALDKAIAEAIAARDKLNAAIAAADYLPADATIKLTGAVAGEGNVSGIPTVVRNTWIIKYSNITTARVLRIAAVNKNNDEFGGTAIVGGAFGTRSGYTPGACVLTFGIKKSMTPQIKVSVTELVAPSSRLPNNYFGYFLDGDVYNICLVASAWTYDVTVTNVNERSETRLFQEMTWDTVPENFVRVDLTSNLPADATIKLTGAVTGEGTFDGSGDLSIETSSTIIVGGGEAQKWHKFAYVTGSATYYGLTLIVHSASNPVLNEYNNFGILRAFATAYGEPGVYLRWDYKGIGISTDSFAITYKKSNNEHIFELWYRNDSAYRGVTVCAANDFVGQNTSKWKLENNWGQGESTIPESDLMTYSVMANLTVGELFTTAETPTADNSLVAKKWIESTNITRTSNTIYKTNSETSTYTPQINFVSPKWIGSFYLSGLQSDAPVFEFWYRKHDATSVSKPRLTGVGNPIHDSDAVNYGFLKTYVAQQIAAATNSASTLSIPASAPSLETEILSEKEEEITV